MVPRVTHLLVKTAHGQPLKQVEAIEVNPQGIKGQVICAPLRQALILPTDTLKRFSASSGDLMENMLVDIPDLHDLPSGTVLGIGEVKVRLTFHCEPCKRVGHVASAKDLMHQRGYLAAFLTAGRICVKDEVRILPEVVEAVPYATLERLVWFLDKNRAPINTRDLLWALGLPMGYARALPALLKKLGGDYQDRVQFMKDEN